MIKIMIKIKITILIKMMSKIKIKMMIKTMLTIMIKIMLTIMATMTIGPIFYRDRDCPGIKIWNSLFSIFGVFFFLSF